MTRANAIPGLVRDMTAAWNAHDAERLLAFYSPEYEGSDVCESAPQRGLADARRSIEQYLRAFPGAEVTIEDTLVEDDRLVVVWRARGKHQGTMLNIPATGREVEVCGVSVLTTRDGKVIRARQVWDVAALLRSIGLLPELL
jgi:steroid delta-isomerase-like uncharacterized protein